MAAEKPGATPACQDSTVVPTVFDLFGYVEASAQVPRPFNRTSFNVFVTAAIFDLRKNSTPPNERS